MLAFFRATTDMVFKSLNMNERIWSLLLGLLLTICGSAICWQTGRSLFETVEFVVGARNWRCTYATITRSDLIPATTTSQAKLHVAYQYQWNGKSYEGSRITPKLYAVDRSLERASALNARYIEAMQKGERLCAWIDPQAPQNAVLERKTSGVATGFLAFVVIASGTAALYGLFLLLGKPYERPTPGEYAYQGPRALMFFLPVTLILIACTALTLLYDAGIILILFWGGVAAFYMRFMWIGIRLSLAFSGTRLVFSPLPLRPGHSFKGRILERKASNGASYSLQLRCKRREDRGDDSSLVTHLWESAASTRAADGHHFSFDVPAGLPASNSEADDPCYKWEIEVKKPSLKHGARFLLHVQNEGPGKR